MGGSRLGYELMDQVDDIVRAIDVGEGGYFETSSDQLDLIDAAVNAQGVPTIRADCRGMTTKLTFLDQLKNEFTFPEYFGRNWGAMVDSLSELIVAAPGWRCCFILDNVALIGQDLTIMRGALGGLVSKLPGSDVYIVVALAPRTTDRTSS